MQQRVRISEAIFHELSEQVRKAYPRECCGVLLGTEDYRILEGRPLNNRVREDAALLHFQMDPLEIYRLEREAEEKGLCCLGFYHSHPDHAAVPSREDQQYMIPEQFYLIISVTGKGLGETKGYIKKEEIIGVEVVVL